MSTIYPRDHRNAFICGTPGVSRRREKWQRRSPCSSVGASLRTATSCAAFTAFRFAESSRHVMIRRGGGWGVIKSHRQSSFLLLLFLLVFFWFFGFSTQIRRFSAKVALVLFFLRLNTFFVLLELRMKWVCIYDKSIVRATACHRCVVCCMFDPKFCLARFIRSGKQKSRAGRLVSEVRAPVLACFWRPLET